MRHGPKADAQRRGRTLSYLKRREVPNKRYEPQVGPLCAVCDHIRELHDLPFIECSHPFTPKGDGQ